MKSVHDKLYFSLLIVFLLILFFGVIIILQDNVNKWTKYPESGWTSELYNKCKYHNKIIFTVNDFDYDTKFLDVDISIVLTNDSRLFKNKTDYQDEINREPFVFGIYQDFINIVPFRFINGRPFFFISERKDWNFYYYSSFFDKKDDLTYHFKGKLPLKYPTHMFPFEGAYYGRIGIKDYGINHEENFEECFDYWYINNVKDPDVLVILSPGTENENSSFDIIIDRFPDPYKPRIILVFISLILILSISVYLLFVKDNTIDGVLTLFISLFVLQSFKPQQIKSFTLFDDIILATFFIGLIIVILSLFKTKIREKLDEFLTFLSGIRIHLYEIIVKFVRKRD